MMSESVFSGSKRKDRARRYWTDILDGNMHIGIGRASGSGSFDSYLSIDRWYSI